MEKVKNKPILAFMIISKVNPLLSASLKIKQIVFS